jgi:predicted transcriptional regulator
MAQINQQLLSPATEAMGRMKTSVVIAASIASPVAWDMWHVAADAHGTVGSFQRCFRASRFPLDGQSDCHTLSYKMRDTLTISLPPALRREMQRAAKRAGTTSSAYVREAVKQRLALEQFRALRASLVPRAQAQGIYTDADVFKLVS